LAVKRLVALVQLQATFLLPLSSQSALLEMTARLRRPQFGVRLVERFIRNVLFLETVYLNLRPLCDSRVQRSFSLGDEFWVLAYDQFVVRIVEWFIFWKQYAYIPSIMRLEGSIEGQTLGSDLRLLLTSTISLRWTCQAPTPLPPPATQISATANELAQRASRCPTMYWPPRTCFPAF
jgi:hypothetical protein